MENEVWKDIKGYDNDEKIIQILQNYYKKL